MEIRVAIWNLRTLPAKRIEGACVNGWKEYRLGEAIELIGGRTPKTTIPEQWDGDILWLSVVDFNTGNKYVYTTEKLLQNKARSPCINAIKEVESGSTARGPLIENPALQDPQSHSICLFI
jgi:hypothetical protein